jgi:phosphatidylserine/phosphatidylglycerophosphate/cardiolipin synthase-like enzyme
VGARRRLQYFAFAKEAMRRARRRIMLMAWDLDTRVRLTPQRRLRGRPDRLGTFLNWLAASRPGLSIHVLRWDYAELFDLRRGTLPLLLQRWASHPRLHYQLDRDRPTGACQHQKLLVVDDAVAFCGGLDITSNRWDTPAHRAHEPLRRQPDGQPYEPFHDVMMAVDGDAARAVAARFRERWLIATGEDIAPVFACTDPWPKDLEPVLRNVGVGIARTDPAWNGRGEVREIEALHLAAIAAARRTIYVESQYFASFRVAGALEDRLAEPDGPEVVVVNPVRTRSWLENGVMQAARSRLAGRLRAADRYGRFLLLAPLDENGGCITVHAKVMVVDDEIVRVGSANLNNRSMGLDTECDLAVEARPGSAGDADRSAIAAFRDRLLAEHLGVRPEVLTGEVNRCGSLAGAIAALRREPGQGRTLALLPVEERGALVNALVDACLFDSERPVRVPDIVWSQRGWEEMMWSVLPSRIPARSRWVALLVAALGTAGLWLR